MTQREAAAKIAGVRKRAAKLWESIRYDYTVTDYDTGPGVEFDNEDVVETLTKALLAERKEAKR
jgi:hypothetical protein